jgi:HSP20 family protein
MSFWNIEPEDWFRRLFGCSSRATSRRGSDWFGDEMFRQFDEMKREMERMFEEQFKDIQTKAPKELIREFDNVKGPFAGFGAGSTATRPLISSEREPLADITTTDKEIKVAVEVPGVSKENIKVNAYDSSVEVKSDDPQRDYHQVIDLPEETDIETARSTYRNGILEIIFNKKEQTKPKGKEVKVE